MSCIISTLTIAFEYISCIY